MGFQPSNALSAIPDVHTRAELKSLWLAFGAVQKSVSTLIRNNQAVVDYTPSSITLTAGAGLTGGGDLTANRSFAVGAGTGITVAADSVAVDQSFTPTWTGVHTFSAQDVHNAGVSLGTSGRLSSAVADASNAVSFLVKPTVDQGSGGSDARGPFSIQDSSGNAFLHVHATGLVEFGSNQAYASSALIAVGSAITKAAGIQFAPSQTSSTGITYAGVTNTCVGAYFKTGPPSSTSTVASAYVGGVFETQQGGTLGANVADWWGGWFRGTITGVTNSGRTWASIGGWKVFPISVTAMNAGTCTNYYGGYVSNSKTSASLTVTNSYGLYVEEHTGGATINNGIFFANATAGYKAIAIRDQNAAIGSSAAGRIDIIATDFLVNTTNLAFYNQTPVARPSAYTQTYSTTTKTHANLTSATLTDSSGGTANTTVAAVSGSGDDVNINNNFADVTAQINALRVDLVNLKGVVNSVIDDGQALGLLQ